jgi:hypothetical protein
MATTPVTVGETLDAKIAQAAQEAAVVASTFSPAIGAAISTGAAMEPVVAGFIHMLIGLFTHHVKAAVPVPASAPKE